MARVAFCSNLCVCPSLLAKAVLRGHPGKVPRGCSALGSLFGGEFRRTPGKATATARARLVTFQGFGVKLV